MSRLCLDVCDAVGHTLRALPLSSRVTIGSDAAADLQLQGPGIPPFVAVLDTETLELEVRDDGLDYDGVRLACGEKVQLETGVTLRLGAAALSLADWRPSEPRLLTSYAYFEQRGVEECLRCVRSKGNFSVVYVREMRRERLSEVEAALASTVRLPDVVASYCPGIYVMMLFGASADSGQLVAGRVGRVLRHVGVEPMIGVASYPVDGKTIDALSQLAAQRALGETTDDSDITNTGNAAIGPEQHLIRVARSELSVLILGETGSGKEILAARLHKLSTRSDKPFVKLNCAAFTETLLESELFGHERGSFTGAVGMKKGLLETAQGGTVFLDEVGEMPPAMQAKMLRVLEERVVMRVGGLKPTTIDVRFIAATNRDLETEVSRGKFRSDLFFRLDGATIVVPPLRDRMSEFEGIVRALITDLATRAKLPRNAEVSPNAMKLLKAYQWPGNIRELRNMLERALWLSEGQTIHRTHLPQEKLAARFAEFRPDRYAPAAEGTLTRGEAVNTAPRPGRADAPSLTRPDAMTSGISVVATPTGVPAVAAGPAHVAAPEVLDGRRRRAGTTTVDQEALEVQERKAIERVLTECGGNQSEAARRLGVSRRTLIKRIESYGLTRPRKSPTDG